LASTEERTHGLALR